MAFGALVASILPVLAQQAPAATAVKNYAVFQATGNDRAHWSIILNNMQNLRDGLGGEPIESELVAFGPGVNMLKSDSLVKERATTWVSRYLGRKVVTVRSATR